MSNPAEDPRLKRLRVLASSSVVGTDIKWLLGERDRLRDALTVIAQGTLCPELFPELSLEANEWEIQAKTAVVSATVALEDRRDQ